MYVRLHCRPSLRWIITATLVGVGSVALNACMGEDSVSGTPDEPTNKPALAQTASLDPDPSYYEADVHIAFYGGFRPDAAREYSYHLVRTLRDGVWSVELTNPTSASSWGGDIARVTLTGPGDVAVTTRSGKPAVLPDPATVRAALRQVNATQPWNPTTAWLSVRPAAPAPSIKGKPGLGAQGGPLTHDVLGSAGRARSLSRLASSAYAERPGPVGRRRFERARGARLFVVEVDAVTGAAVHEEIREGGRLVAATDRDYRQAGPLALLESEVITRFDSAGAPRERFERRLTNVRTERSR